MPESAAHARLVMVLLDYLHREFASLTDIVIRDDSAAPLRRERPPTIGGFVPDLFAVDVPTTRTLIGEAKTIQDLETDHSRAQIVAFLGYLGQVPNGTFLLSVPLEASATAKRILRQVSAELPPAPTRILVLDGLTP